MDKFFDQVAEKWKSFQDYIGSIKANWKEGRKPRAVGKVILPLLPVALTAALLAYLWSIRETIIKIFSGILLMWTIFYACKQEKGLDKKNTRKPDAVVLKHARQGRAALLDHIMLVAESLSEQTEIYSPRSRGELAYPSVSKCITIENGVAVFTVRLRYEDEITPSKFLERFNDRMAQKLDSGELWGNPPAVFYDKDNTPHTAIQAIRCVPIPGEKCVRLDVVRVNEAALALIDEVESKNPSEADERDQLYDDEL